MKWSRCGNEDQKRNFRQTGKKKKIRNFWIKSWANSRGEKRERRTMRPRERSCLSNTDWLQPTGWNWWLTVRRLLAPWTATRGSEADHQPSWLAFLLLLQVTAGDPLSFSLPLLPMTGRVAVSFLVWQGKKLSIIQLTKTQYTCRASNRHFVYAISWWRFWCSNTLYNLEYKSYILFSDKYIKDIGVNAFNNCLLFYKIYNFSFCFISVIYLHARKSLKSKAFLDF